MDIPKSFSIHFSALGRGEYVVVGDSQILCEVSYSTCQYIKQKKIEIQYWPEYSRDGASWYFGEKRANFLMQNYTNNIRE